MKEICWLKPKLVAQVSFTEWTNYGLLRHATFEGLRDDKQPREVVRELCPGCRRRLGLTRHNGLSSLGRLRQRGRNGVANFWQDSFKRHNAVATFGNHRVG